MANIKFTEFPSATTLTGTEIIPIVQAGTNKKVTATLLKAFADSGYVPYTGATTDLNLDTHDLYTAKVWLNDIPNAGFGSLELTDGVLHFEDVDGHNMFSMEDGYFAVNNGPTIRALFNVSALTANRDFALPNASGTLALTSNLSSYLPLAGGTLTGNLDIRASNTYFGSVKGYIYVSDDQMNCGFSTNAEATLNFNYYGYNQGFGQFRNFDIYNGKGTRIFNLVGSTGAATFSGITRFNGDYVSFNNNGYIRCDATNILSLQMGSSGFRVRNAGDSATFFDINTSGAATFASSVTTGADATINGVTVGKGGGNVAQNTAFGINTLELNTSGFFNTALGSTAMRYNTTGTRNSAVGYGALINNTTGSSNCAFGISAVEGNTTGSNNVGIGQDSLNATSTGSNNSALGRSALQNNTASNNTAVGFEAAYANTSGTEMVAIGCQALKANTTGGSNTAIGHFALKANTTGSANTSIGGYCLFNNTTGVNNVSLGYATLLLNASGSNNTAIGQAALLNNTVSNNTAVGFEAGYSNTSGTANVAIGFQALRANTTAANNTAIGDTALFANTTGAANTALGQSCFSNNTTGNFNIGIGASQQTGNFNNCIMLGILDTATGNGQLRFGSSTIPIDNPIVQINASSQYLPIFINGVSYKMLLA
jgi:hypothetical protein